MVAGSLALYRKYRSATFGELIGQEHVTAPLTQALRSGRINHAYLFSGPRGCGKTSSARILARSLNCVEGPTPDPCGVCDSCVELAPNGSGSIDVIEIDAASHGGVDDARDLRERAFYAPARDRYKVYVIDEAHMVSKEGFNALLKLVEEPPEFLVFVFATTEPEKVLQTIRSRTHHYPFRLVPPGVLRAHLEAICAAEGVAVEPAVLPLVVRAGGGSVRDSLSILDQLLAGAGDAGVTYADAVALLGVTDAALIDDIVDALAAGDAAGVYGTVERVVEAGHDPRRFAADVLDRLRDLVVLDAVPDAGGRGLIDAPPETLARMVDQSQRLGAAALARFGQIVHDGLVDMRGTTSPRLLLELLCARMLLPDASGDVPALLQRIERLERRQELTPTPAKPAERAQPTTPAERAEPVKPATPAERPAPPVERAAPAERPAPPASAPAPPVPAPAPAAAPAADPAPAAAGQLDAVALRGLWPEVLAAASRLKRRTEALLRSAGSQIHSVDGSDVVITASTSVLAKMLADASNTEIVQAAIVEVIGGQWRVTVVVGDGPAGAPPAASPRPASPPAAPVAAPVSAAASWPTVAEVPSAPAEPATGRGRGAPIEDREDDYDLSEPPPDPSERPDPGAEAMALLQSELGARPLEEF